MSCKYKVTKCDPEDTSSS